MQSDPTQQPTPSSRKLLLFTLIAGVGIATLVVTGIQSRQRSDAKLRDWTDAQAIATVAVAPPGTRTLTPVLNLPGRLEAFARAQILARVSGYVKSWNIDIGTPVKTGDLLAEIEAPDLDQQLLQARADLLSAQSSATLSEATLTRRQALANSKIVSQQDLDERLADLRNRKAVVKAQQANVDRLLALSTYKRVTAPFDGIVTARDTDVGALINAGGGPPMFVVSDTRKLRIFVNVPQAFVPLIRRGSKTSVTVPEYPERAFDAVVEASSQAIDAASGTTRMQLIVENPDGLLLPGGYSNIRIDLSREKQPLHIPASALIMGREGPRVAVVADGDRVSFRKIVIARDLGQEIEITSGLQADDRVITTPPDGLNEGDQVRVVGSGGKPAPAAQAVNPDNKTVR